MNIHAFVTDARGPDPTGTAGIRRSFRAAGKLRLNMFRSAMRQAVIEHDVLGLGGGGLALQPPETRLQAFNGWARVAAGQALEGPWLSQWVARAWASGEAVGALQTRSEAPGEGSGAWAELAKIELQAIEAAVVQALMREAAIALTKRRANKTMTWRRMAKAFDKVGPRRVMALANTFCVACHNRGRLAAYRAAGITKVGVVAEKLLPKQALLLPGGLGDALTHDAKHKGYREKKPARPEWELSEVTEPIEVGVRTAEDEFVCIECDAFAANSPHDIDDVEDTLPIHPNCRCTWFPWDDKRFSRDEAIEDARKKTERELLLEQLGRKRHRALARLAPRKFENRFLREDAWNPNQPREPAGTSEGGQFASITGGGISGGATGGPAAPKKKLFEPSKDKAHHEMRVQNTLQDEAKRNDNYRYIVGKLVEEAKSHGADVSIISGLKQKIGESYYKQGLLKKEKGLEAQANAMIYKGKQYGYQPTLAESNQEHAPTPKPDPIPFDPPELTTGAEPGTPAYEGEQAEAKATIPGATPAWTKVGGQAGSVAGGFYLAPMTGQKWYVKTPKTEAHVNADLLSNQLYKLAGVPVSHEVKTVLEGKPAVASEFIPGTKTYSQGTLDEQGGAILYLRENFAVDAWLGNRDVMGQDNNNVLLSPSGVPFRIDQGGTLMYRAQGETKEFGSTVGEITSMRDPKINAQTASVFGNMTDAEVSASIDKVLAIPDYSIIALVNQHGLAGQGVAATLIARKNWLAEYQKTLDVPGADLPAHVKAAAEAEIEAEAAEEELLGGQTEWMTKLEQKFTKATATAAELEKAKKTGTFYPAPTSELGKAVVKAFNEKWATKTPEAHELEQKVAEYKATKAALAKIDEMEAEVAAKATAQLKKEQAAATKLAKIEAEAKAKAESAKHQAELAKIAADIGIDPEHAEQVDTLVQLAGGDKAKIIQQFKKFYEEGTGKHGYPVTPFESAMIQSYVGPNAYAANAKLRSGVWDDKTHVFANAINTALTKMPPYVGTIYRGFTADTETQATYVPGAIIQWHGFSSCGKSGSFGGNMQCTIEPLPPHKTRAKDLGKFNPSEAGGEVLIKAHTPVKVIKVEGKPGGTMHVHLKEVEAVY